MLYVIFVMLCYVCLGLIIHTNTLPIYTKYKLIYINTFKLPYKTYIHIYILFYKSLKIKSDMNNLEIRNNKRKSIVS